MEGRLFIMSVFDYIKEDSSKADSTEFQIGEVVEARSRLWRIDQKHQEEKKGKKFIYYSVSNVTGQPSAQILIPSIEPVRKSSIPNPKDDIIGSPIYQKLLIQALRLDLIYGTTSFISLQNSKVIPISYQMVPVLMALNLPNARLLIADDVGLGKTIEAGLIIQELLGRKKINRVLFVVPANLREQWQTILKNFFGIDAVIMSRRNRRNLEAELLVGGNPWGYYNFIITSTDYAKRSGVKEEIIQFPWDLVIIDEAHNVMKPHLGAEDEKVKGFKQSYGLARILAEKFDNLLLLTATPHNGYRDCFASLLELVNPEIIKKTGPQIEINKKAAIQHVCQRRRKDVQSWIAKSKYGKDPFPERDSLEVYVKPSDEFKQVIRLLSEFGEHVVNRSLDLATNNKKLSYWVIFHFHKRAISSPNAIFCSVKNRLEELEKKINKLYTALETSESFLSVDEAAQAVMDGYETDRLTEEERDLRSDKNIQSKSIEDLKKERDILLKVKKTSIQLMEQDNKIYTLLENLIPERLKVSPKIIIFTRYIDTLTYIEEKIQAKIESTLKYKNLDLFSVHGQMPSQKRQDIYNSFLKSMKGILITTDCMAEGIDLQFSSNQVINYELTWNPNRLEQRNGRVDRFGQPKDKVYIRTLILEDSLEIQILKNLLSKAQRIKNDYGFTPGFFGDPDSIMDHILKQEPRQQATLLEFFDKAIIDEIVSQFFSEERTKEILDDSFYGQSNIDLEEIEERMRITTDQIGDSRTLFEFINQVIDLYEGQLKQINTEEEIFEIVLPDKILQDIGIDIKDFKKKLTPNMEVGVKYDDVEPISLKNPLIAGLIEKVKNEAFLDDNQLYGRTAAFSTEKYDKVSTLYFFKLRYLVDTEPKAIIEEIILVGVELFDSVVLEQATVENIWNSDKQNVKKKEVELKKHLKKALNHPKLEEVIQNKCKDRLNLLIEERRNLISDLKTQGITADLEGLDKLNLIGYDLLAVALVYPNMV